MVRKKRQPPYHIPLTAMALLLGARVSLALPITFEGLADGTPVNIQYAAQGVTFTNATTTALVSGAVGGSLNEINFPPYSGVTVVFDDGGPIMITLSGGFTDVQGFFNYSVPISMMAYSDPAGTILVGTVTSAFSSNLAGGAGDPGSSPNELLGISGVGPIASLKIAGDPNGSSFTLDDFNGTPVPEPASLVLLGSGIGSLWLRRKVWKRRPVPPGSGL